MNTYPEIKNFRLSDYVLERYGSSLMRWAGKSPSRSAHSAIILDRRMNAICYGYNRGDVHAEEDAIWKWRRAYLPRKRDAYLVFVVRVGSDRKLGPVFRRSSPCRTCQKLIDSFDLKVGFSE